MPRCHPALLLGALLCLPLAAPRAAAPPAPTGAPDWNPRPAEGDLIVPLPCEQALVFRRVPAPVADSPLSDRRELLGDEQASLPYSEFVHEAFLAGAFGRGASAHFWLGKYEVTRSQYVAVTSGCEALAALPAEQRRLPQGGVSWAEAIRFTEAATQAALKLRATALPAEGVARAYVRLPTEAEWEFAVRGGGAVTPNEFRQRLPPMDEPVTAYAQLRRVGRRAPPQPVGLLKPDRLGLYDMLGNVAEMVLDPYRLTRGGRAGGRAGGITARGGDIGAAADTIRSSLRVEYPPVQEDGSPTAPATLGLRVALGLPILTDLTADGALRQAWDQETARQDEALSPAADPQALARSLEEAISDPAQRRAVAALRGAVENERANRLQASERAARSAIGAGAVLIRAFRNEHRGVLGHRAYLAETETALRGRTLTAAETDRLQTARRAVEQYTTARDTSFAVLTGLILQQTELPQKLLQAQLAVWNNENSGPVFETLRRFAGLFVAEVATARSGRTVTPEDAYRRLAGDIR